MQIKSNLVFFKALDLKGMDNTVAKWTLWLKVESVGFIHILYTGIAL